MLDGKLVSRTLKPIPNARFRALYERPELEGFDGELIAGSMEKPRFPVFLGFRADWDMEKR